MSEQIRILRILEYTGDREQIEKDLERRGVKGQQVCPKYIIREAILGEFAEIIQKGIKS